MPLFPSEIELARQNIPPLRLPRPFRELVEDCPDVLFNFGDLRFLGDQYRGERPLSATILYRSKTRFNKAIRQQSDGSWKTARQADPASYGFRVCEAEPKNLKEWAQLLEALERQPELVLIRGRRVDSGRSFLLDKHRRALFSSPRAPDQPPGDFEDCARAWMCSDLDGVVIPDRFDLDEFESIAEWIICEHLPAPFRGVSAAWQISSTHGLSGEHIAKIHVFMMLDRPVDGRTLDKFLQARRRIFDIDPAPCRAVQPIYCAAPEFERWDGSEAPDPFAGKSRVGLTYADAEFVTLAPHLEEWRREARFDEAVAEITAGAGKRFSGPSRPMGVGGLRERFASFFDECSASGGYRHAIWRCLCSAAGRAIPLEEAAPIIREVANAVAAERGVSGGYIRDTLNGSYLTPDNLRREYENARRKVCDGRLQDNRFGVATTATGPQIPVECGK